MTKYYCDVCKEETHKLTEYILPEMTTKTVYDTNGGVCKEYHVPLPIKKEICYTCARQIGGFIANKDNIINNWADSINKLIDNTPKPSMRKIQEGFRIGNKTID